MVEKSYNSRPSGLSGVAQIVAQTEPKEMQYLTLRGNVWWFSRRAPLPLKPGTNFTLDTVEAKVGQNGYIRFSLETSSRKEATRLARKFAHLVDEAADQRRNRKPKFAAIDGTPTSHEIDQAAARMYAQLLAADEATATHAMAVALKPELAEVAAREPDRYQWSAADLPPETLAGEVQLLQRLGGLAI